MLMSGFCSLLLVGGLSSNWCVVLWPHVRLSDRMSKVILTWATS